MKKILILVLFFSGCSWFAYYDRNQECEKHLFKADSLLQEAVVVIDSLQTELEECQE